MSNRLFLEKLLKTIVLFDSSIFYIMVLNGVGTFLRLPINVYKKTSNLIKKLINKISTTLMVEIS